MRRVLAAVLAIACLYAGPIAHAGAQAGLADKAERYVGWREGSAALDRLVRVNTRRVRWCAALVRAMFDSPPTGSLAVTGWDSNAIGPVVASPRRGDLAFWRHRHIGIVTAVVGGKVCTISGNRSNRVARSCEPRNKFRKFRRVK